MYSTKSSRSAADFLKRLHYLINEDLINIHTDNGSEFSLEFERALKDLELTHWYSRPHTPKDNPRLEKFNGTLQYEWLNDGNFTPRVNEFNHNLTSWLEEYNFVRPHQALDYRTPFEYLELTQPKTEVSSMCPASAFCCKISEKWYLHSVLVLRKDNTRRQKCLITQLNLLSVSIPSFLNVWEIIRKMYQLVILN